MSNNMAWQSGKPSVVRASRLPLIEVRTSRLRPLIALALLLIILGGCEAAPRSQLGHWEGPQLLSNSSVEAWEFRGDPAARRLKTDHYLIYTTIKNPDMAA